MSDYVDMHKDYNSLRVYDRRCHNENNELSIYYVPFWIIYFNLLLFKYYLFYFIFDILNPSLHLFFSFFNNSI